MMPHSVVVAPCRLFVWMNKVKKCKTWNEAKSLLSASLLDLCCMQWAKWVEMKVGLNYLRAFFKVQKLFDDFPHFLYELKFSSLKKIFTLFKPNLVFILFFHKITTWKNSSLYSWKPQAIKSFCVSMKIFLDINFTKSFFCRNPSPASIRFHKHHKFLLLLRFENIFITH